MLPNPPESRQQSDVQGELAEYLESLKPEWDEALERLRREAEMFADEDAELRRGRTPGD